MPELPEVETTVNGITPWIKGKTIKQILVHQDKLRWQVPVALLQAQGQRINKTSRRGKYIILHCDSGNIIIHLGMSGSLSLFDAGSRRKKHDHIEWLFDQYVLRFHDPRKFGCVLWHQGDIQQHPLISRLGVEPLSNELNADYLYQQSRSRKTAIKQFIMNAQIVVGVGNIYANESLFLAKINPKIQAGRIGKVRYQILAGKIKQVLDKAIKEGGTTLKDFVNAEGKPGYFQQQLNVYGKEGQPCPVCQQAIKKIMQQQRSSFYCPHCQR